MNTDGTLPPKKDVTRALLLRGNVFVHLDPRASGVSVPEWLRKQPQLVLQIGLDMPIPIRDLRVDDDGVFGTLSFNRAPFSCRVAWDAVFALVGDDGRGMVWPDDLPPEIAAEVEREAGRQAGRGARPPEPLVLGEMGESDDRPSVSAGRGVRAGVSDAAAPVTSLAEVRKQPGGRPAAARRPRDQGATGKPRNRPPYLRLVK